MRTPGSIPGDPMVLGLRPPPRSSSIAVLALAAFFQQPGMGCAQDGGSVAEIEVVVRTTVDPGSGSDDTFELCIDPTSCWALENPAIGGPRPGRIDEIRLPVGPLPRSSVSEVTLRPAPGLGQDSWTPDCLAVLLDGDLLYCNDQLSSSIGTNPGDVPAFTDTNVGFQSCAGCYGSVLTHGPMIGHTTPSSSRIWLRTASRLPVQVRYGTPDLSGAATSPTVHPDPADDFTGIIELDGLVPGTRYSYEVLVDGVPVSSPGLSFRTAPAGGAVFEAVMGSCVSLDEQPALPSALTHEPEIMIFLGDYHYANSTDPARLDFYYRRTRGQPDEADLLARTATWAVWDDHDFTGNDSLGNSPDKERSLAAFERYWANGSYGSGGADGIWSSFVWGDVEFFLLDDRYYRDPAGGTMLGPVQLDWLLQGLRSSTAKFKVLISGSQWALYSSNDSWAAFPEERQVIFDWIMDQGISGVVLVSGDRHRAEIRRLRDATPRSYPLFDFTTSPLASVSYPCHEDPPPPELRIFCLPEASNFGLMRFDTLADPPQMTYEIRDEYDVLAYSMTLTLDDISIPGLLADDFESGDLSAWTLSHP